MVVVDRFRYPQNFKVAKKVEVGVAVAVVSRVERLGVRSSVLNTRVRMGGGRRRVREASLVTMHSLS